MKRGGPLRRRRRLQSNADVQRAWEKRTRERRLADPEHHFAAAHGLNRSRTEAIKHDSEWEFARQLVIERSGGLCEANWPGVCKPGPHAGQHVHHRQLRSQGGDHSLDNLMHVCEVVHHHAHNVDRAGAEARGIIRRRAPR